MKINKREKGITLVALIITIIVMLILIAVSIRIVITSGVFDSAKVASRKTDSAYKEESDIGSSVNINGKTYNSVEEYVKQEGTVGGGTGEGEGEEKYEKQDRSYLKIGDYVEYTPDLVTEKYTNLTVETTGISSGSADTPAEGISQDTTLKWRIMSINEDGTVDLISTKPTTEFLGLGGWNGVGFNNGVFLLNDICKRQYSNATLKAQARSINLLDIENKISAKGITARSEYNAIYDSKYGNIVDCDVTKTPDIYKHVSKDTQGESMSYYTSPIAIDTVEEPSLTVKNTDYEFTNTPVDYFNDATFHQLIFGTEASYWIATRAVHGSTVSDGTSKHKEATFSLRVIQKTKLTSMNNVSYSSKGNSNGNSYRIRPVVTLGNNIQISETGGADAEHPRTLTAI